MEYAASTSVGVGSSLVRSPDSDSSEATMPVVDKASRKDSSVAGDWTQTGEIIKVGSMRSRDRRAKDSGALDPSLLARLADLLDDVEHLPPEEMSLTIESVRCNLCELWATAQHSSQYHRSVLTIAENFLAGREIVDALQAAALRGAIVALYHDHLTEQYVDVIRSHFIDTGYNPLAPLSDLETEYDDDSEHR